MDDLNRVPVETPGGAGPVRTEVGYLSLSDEAAWNAYVLRHPHGSPFHLTAWGDAVERTFGHEPRYLVARRGGVVVGGLPLGHVKSLLFGSMLVSSPFAVYGGVLADDEATALALEARAYEIASRLRVGYLELRDRIPAAGRAGERKELYVTFRKELPPDGDGLIAWVPRKARRMVRLGIKGGLEGRLTRSARDVDVFYRLFAHNLKKLGTPAFPKSLIHNLLSCFGDAADILLIEKAGRPAAGVLNFYFRDEVLPYYSGADEVFNPLGINNFLYYDLMLKSIQRGFRVFDFGRSKEGTGPFNFKRHFGFEPEPLPYRIRLVEDDEMPNLNPTNPRYAKAIDLWKKLPLAVTTAAGPWIVRGIP